MLINTPTFCKQWVFDTSKINAEGVDISVFNKGGQLPGTYLVDIYLNKNIINTEAVNFIKINNSDSLRPCLTIKQLSSYGIKVEEYPELNKNISIMYRCANLNAISGLNIDFNYSTQTLLITVPQVALRLSTSEIAPEESWDDGIAAFFINYNINVTKTVYKNKSLKSERTPYAHLSPGINIGPWRVRHSESWQKGTRGEYHWERNSTFVERGIHGIKSRLTLGENFTLADIFDSFPFRGIMLGTDNKMIPFSQRSYSPQIRGIARTYSRVEIKQNGYVVFEGNVPPGPFAIENLRSISSGGLLDVTVHESEGPSQHFSVPYQTPLAALHKGHFNYNFAAGDYRRVGNNTAHEHVIQGTLVYGLPWDLTLFTGFQQAAHFQAYSAGIAASLGLLGSISLDNTLAYDKQPDRSWEHGNSLRLRYSKQLESTKTTFIIDQQNTLSPKYNSFQEFIDTHGKRENINSDYSSKEKFKSRTTFTLTQPLASYGYLNINSYLSKYYRKKKYTGSFGANYNININSLNLTLGLSRNYHHKRTEKSINLMVSFPFNIFFGTKSNVTWQTISSPSASLSNQLGISGRGFDNQLGWSMAQSYRMNTPHAKGKNSGLFSLGWNGRYGLANSTYSQSDQAKRMSISVMGGALITREGLTLSQQLNDTVALIETPGASGIAVSGLPGIRTDYRGYTTNSYILPYQRNIISLDPTTLPDDAEISQTDIPVTPTEGAIVPVRYVTHIGKRALITLIDPLGKPIPFGAFVTAETSSGTENGIVGDKGQVYLSGLPEHGRLTAKWGMAKGQSCTSSYHLPNKPSISGIFEEKLTCLK